MKSGMVACVVLIALSSSALMISFCEAATGWSKTYSATGSASVIQTSDGGYALAGNVGQTTQYGNGTADAWLAKTNSSGDIEWSKTYGGAKDDVVYSAIQTKDGGYALAGYSYSYGGYYGVPWLVKTDMVGNLQWNRTFLELSDGRTLMGSVAQSLIQTSDGGYALAGGLFFLSGGGFWLVKTDPSGNTQWSKTYGTSNNTGSSNTAYSVIQTTDGGYALAGQKFSSNAITSSDFWLVKTDSSGNMQWNQTYGGSDTDVAYSVIQTSDGGFAVAGWTFSFGSGGAQGWLVKTTPQGNMQWSRTYGTKGDVINCVIQTGDGGYAMAGSINSYGSGGGDFWLVKTDSSGNMQWSQAYGGTKDDRAGAVVQTNDEGYALAGYTSSYGSGENNFWLVKTDANGVVPEFSLPPKSTELFPTALVVAVTVVIATLVAVGVLVYFKKRS